MVKLPYRVIDERRIIDSPEWRKERDQMKRRYEEHREERIAQVAAWQRANPKRVAAASQAWRDRNPDKRRESVRKSRARPGYRQAEKAARRAGEPTTPEAREYITILARDPCSYCGNPCEQVDHIVPIADDGDGQWGNLTAACARCNVRKGRMPLLGFLLR